MDAAHAVHLLWISGVEEVAFVPRSFHCSSRRVCGERRAKREGRTRGTDRAHVPLMPAPDSRGAVAAAERARADAEARPTRDGARARPSGTGRFRTYPGDLSES